jgi:zinc protease
MKSFFVLSVLCMSACLALTGEETLIVETLDNGLVVILKEKHAAPVAAVQIWVRTGSADEGDLLGSGVSHFVEHMLFKGTQRRKARDFDQEVHAVGGELNAYTSTDRTVYHVTLPAAQFNVALDGLADLVQNAAFPAEEFEPERAVVGSEIRMGLDDPDSFFQRLVTQTVYDVHPYRFPIIGLEQVFERLSREDLVAYYRKRYAPHNMFFVAVGAFDAAEKLKTVRETFKDFKDRPVIESFRPPEPLRLSPREANAEHPRVTEARLAVVFPGFSLNHPDLYALDAAARILGQGRSSRLYRRLLGGQQAWIRNVSAYNYTPRDPGAFYLNLRLDPENIPTVQTVIREEIERLCNTLVSTEELSRAKRTIASEIVFSNETADGAAEQLGADFLLTGDPNFSKVYRAGIETVTAEEIRAAARKHLVFTRQTTVTMRPESTPKTTAVKKPAPPATAPQPILLELTGGAKLVVLEDASLPAVGFSATFLAGLRSEPQNQSGLSDFTADMLTRGTRKLSAEKFAAAVEDLGAELTATGGRVALIVEGKALNPDFPALLRLTTEILTTPAFTPEETAKTRTLRLAGLQSIFEDSWRLSGAEIMKTLFAGHPYQWPPLGSAESLSRLNVEALREFHKRLFHPKNVVIAVVGDITPGEARTIVERNCEAFLKISTPFHPLTRPDPPPLGSALRKVVTLPEIQEVVMRFAWRGPALENRDRFALDLLELTLSGSGDHLFTEIREKRGLSYAVGAYQQALPDVGLFGVYCGVKPEHAAEAARLCLAGIKKTTEVELSANELERAKTRFLGRTLDQMQGLTNRARRIALDERLGLGADAAWREAETIRAITAGDVLKAARNYLSGNDFALVIVGPTDKKEVLEKALNAATH